MSKTTSPDERLTTFAIQAESETPTHTVVKARDFEFSVDEPEHLGGSDAGPNPVEYLLGSLAGCLNVVGHTVADEMGMSVSGMEVGIEGDLDPAKFLGKDTDPRAGYQDVRVNISVETDADASTVEAWLESVRERCPVSDNIGNTTPLDISLEIE
ncbi:MAG: OsmC family protein [Haloferacaceae archaeon]